MRRPFVFLALFLPLSACSDSTGVKHDVSGQWVYRVSAGPSADHPAGCAFSGVMTIVQSGSHLSGRMPAPERICGFGAPVVFDSTTTVSGEVAGDSVAFVVAAHGVELRTSARILGDSLAGMATGAFAGAAGARRFPSTPVIDRGTLQVTGAVSHTSDVDVAHVRSEIDIHRRDQTEGLTLRVPAQVPFAPYDSLSAYWLMRPGTYPLGASGDSIGAAYDLAGASGLPAISATLHGTVQIVEANGQLVRGTVTGNGIDAITGQPVQVSAAFVAHLVQLPDGFGA